MRQPLLIALVLFAVGAIAGTWLAVASGPREAESALSLVPRSLDEPATAAGVGAQEPAGLALPATALLSEGEPAPAERGVRALSGVVQNRFGGPARVRVSLLAEGQEHPPAGAELSEYITAETDSRGRFALTMRSAGPWRLAVGAPGEPLINPVEVRAGEPRAEVTVPGATALRVVFEALPDTEEALTLELLTLREPRTGGGGQERDRTRSGRGGGGEGQGGGGGARGRRGRGRGDGNASNASTTTQNVVHAAWREPQEDAARGRRGRRGAAEGGDQGRGGRRAERDPGDETPAGGDEPAAGPPPERWRASVRHELSAAELASKVVELGGIEAASICRLALRVGRDEYVEGVARFSIQADILAEVHVFPVTLGQDKSLGYRTEYRSSARDAAPVGVRWID